MAKIKVLYAVTKGNWGGAQKYVYDLATALSKDRFEISVAFGQPGLLALKLKEVGITTYPIAYLQRDFSWNADVKSFFELFRLFRTEKPGVVHLNSSKAAGIGVLAARLAGVPRIVFTAHGWPFWEQRHLVSRGIIYFFSWLTALLSHTMIVISDYDLSVANKMPFVKHKIVRIYNGINLNSQFGSAKAMHDEFPRGIVVGTIGELTKNKNQIALIEQAKNKPDMRVAIVGDGEDRLNLMKKIGEYGLKNRVRLIGFRPANEALSGFDIFVLPSIKEGLPYVILEAGLAGLPVIATRVGGVAEIVENNVSGILVEPGNSPALAEAINYLTVHPEKRQEFGRRLRQKVLRDFSLEKMVEKTIAIYEK